MRNLWIAGAVAVVAIVTVVIYQQTPSDTGTASTPQSTTVIGTVEPSNEGNPLASATHEQFRMWVPRHPIPCNEIIYAKPQPEHKNHIFCINLVIDRVADATNKRLSKEDVLDSKAQARWAEVMEG